MFSFKGLLKNDLKQVTFRVNTGPSSLNGNVELI